MKELKDLRTHFKDQLDETLRDINQLTQKISSLNEKVNQLKGAMYALDTLDQILQKGEENGKKD